MIEKQKRHIHLVCNDGITINASINIFGEQRTIDLVNNLQEKFILLNDVEISQQEDLRSFRLAAKIVETESTIILNKSLIKWITEI
jgi:hypothetical protein